MTSEFYHQSIKFKKDEPAYKKLLDLQDKLLDPTGNKYPLTAILKMALIAYDPNQKEM